MRVLPNYRNNATCYYCGKEVADSSAGVNKKLNCITNTHLASYEYTKINIEVPRCEDCEKKHKKAIIPRSIVFFVVFLIIGWLLLSKDKDFSSSMPNLCFAIILDALFSLVITFFIESPFRVFYHGIVYKDCKDVDETDDYEPIKKLMEIGYIKGKPKAYTHPDPKFDKAKLNKTLNDIVMNDNCVIDDE